MKATPEASFVEIPACRLPVSASAEVVVVGGGTAGFAAAVAAARTGAKTILIERYGYLGGSLTGTYVTNPGSFGDLAGNQIIGGIGWEFAERMEAASAAIINRNLWTVQTFPEAAKEVILEMVMEAGVQLYLHSWFSQALLEKNQLAGVVIQSKSGREVITGKSFIDASGDADLAWQAGAPFEKLPSTHLWQTSVDLTICNIDFYQVIAWAEQNPDRIIWFSQPKDLNLPGPRPMISLIIQQENQAAEQTEILHIGPVPTIKLMIYSSIGRVQGSVEIDGTDVRDLTSGEIQARRKAMEHLEYLKKNVPGFEQAVVVGVSPLGVRETRRILGEYILTLDDLLTNARFHDVVALNCRPLDQHLQGDAFKYQLLHGHHDIPLRALIPQGIENLLVAGRCISSDHISNASLRGAATCMATGHAAGTAAALAVKYSGNPRLLDIQELQKTLLEQGAILNAKPLALA